MADNTAVTPATTADNNPVQTQANNASYVAANPTAIGISSLQNPPTPVTLPPPVTAPDTSGAIVAGAGATLQSTINNLTPAPTALDTQQSGLLNDIANLTGQDAGKGDETQTLNDQYGVTSGNQAVTDATNEIATKTAHYNQLQANLGGNGAPETSAVLAAQNAGLMKAQAADIGISQAKLTAAQGNLKLAQNQVTNAINLKYGDIEAQIKTKQAQIDALAPSLTAQEKTQAAAQTALLNQQKTQVAQDKTAATNNLKLVVANNITQPYANVGGRIFDTSTGQDFSTPQDFFAAAGVTSFEDAYAKGLIGDVQNTGLTFETKTVNGQTVKFGYDKTGKVVSQTVLGTTTGTQKVNGSGTTPKPPTAKQDTQSMATALGSVKGQDGYISPQDYKTALAAWQKAGYSAANFKTNFGNLINPADKQDYQ